MLTLTIHWSIRLICATDAQYARRFARTPFSPCKTTKPVSLNRKIAWNAAHAKSTAIKVRSQ
jgi:hypothetical protein